MLCFCHRARPTQVVALGNPPCLCPFNKKVCSFPGSPQSPHLSVMMACGDSAVRPVSGLCWQQLSCLPPETPRDPARKSSVESAGRGRKASWAPRSCSSPRWPAGAQGFGGPSPSPGPRLLWGAVKTGAERRACAFPGRPPRAVLCPTRLPPLCGRRPVSYLRPPTRSPVWTRPVASRAPRAVTHSWSLCQAVLGLPPPPLRAALLGRLVCAAP